MFDRAQINEDRWKTLQARMAAAGLWSRDLDEKFVRSSGKGGQNVNKVATCVCLVHRPSGLAVKCQRSREQGGNRYWARVMLLEKWLRAKDEAARQVITRKEKERRQRRKRSRKEKEKMLAEKRWRSQKKQDRRNLSCTDD